MIANNLTPFEPTHPGQLIRDELALLLEAALGIAAHIWLDLQSDYNMQKVKSDTSFMDRIASIRRIAAVL